MSSIFVKGLFATYLIHGSLKFAWHTRIDSWNVRETSQ
jgi:hypothetical protein